MTDEQENAVPEREEVPTQEGEETQDPGEDQEESTPDVPEREDQLVNLEAELKKVPKDDGKMPLGLWITDDPSVKITVYVYKNLRDGKLFLFLASPLTEERKKELTVGGIHLREFEVPAEFTLPDRKQVDRYRERSSTLHESSGQMMISKSGMRRSLIRYHLLSLGLPHPETGEPLQIDRESGRMSREVEDLLENLHPSLIDMLVLQFEVETGISL